MSVGDVPPQFIHSPLLADKTLPCELLRLCRENSRLPAHLQPTVDQIPGEISRYEAEIARLTVQRGFLQDLNKTSRSIRSPIRRLPAEILTRVFGQCWRNFRENNAPVHMSRASRALHLIAFAPLLALSQVSLRWRTLVFDTAELWTALHIDSAVFQKCEDAKVVGLLEQALKRGQDLPLSLTLDGEDGRNLPTRSWDSGLMGLLTAVAHRWQDLRLCCSSVDVVRIGLPPSLPLLESLDLDLTWTGDPFEPQDFPDAPKLKRFYWPHALDVSMVCLEGLSDARMADVSPSHLALCIQDLSRLSGRVELVLDDPWNSKALKALSLVRVSSHITILVLSAFGEEEDRDESNESGLDAVLSNLTLYLLQTMEFRVRSDNGRLPWPHTTFLALSERSLFPSHLLVLDLRAVHININELLVVLSVLEMLETLFVSDELQPGFHSDEDDDEDDEGSSVSSDDSESTTDRESWMPPLFDRPFLSDLTRLIVSADNSTPPIHELVPRLTTLGYTSHMNFDHNAFIALVRSRACIPREKGKMFHVQLEWICRGAANPNNHVHGQPPHTLNPEKSRELRRLRDQSKIRFEFRRCGAAWYYGQDS
ncbi:hypothetical protein C8F01DRAFT_1169183 [Mycena amicta]|nr:hypothetical protein C8F01DRAFT_1169183 [Mycena amicta]